MKIFTKLSSTKQPKIVVALFAIVFSAFVSACSKNETDVPSISGLMIVNASPGAGTYNVYINDVSSSINQKGALPFMGTIAPYFNITPGANKIKFTTNSSAASVFTETTNLESDKAYSYFLLNDVPNLSGLLIQDDLSLSSSEKGFIRFLNLIPDAGALDLKVSGSTTLVTDKAFKSASEFIQADAKNYDLQLVEKSSGTILATLKDVTITAGKMYTIVAGGMIHPSEVQRGAQLGVITNK